MYILSLMKEEHNIKSEVKPPRMMYTKCGLLIERWSHMMRCRILSQGVWQHKGFFGWKLEACRK